MKEKLLIAATCKDYTIVCDSEPYIVKNEKLMGVIDPSNQKEYFSGMVIHLHEKNGWQFECTEILSREDFDKKVKSWKEVL